jgi:hypothetical protein
MKKLKTISDEYLHQNVLLHKDPAGFGGGGYKRMPEIIPILDEYEIKTILDYGAGEGTLKTALLKLERGYVVVNYDPAMEEYSEKPYGKFDFVTCTDVLEHIEIEYLDNVLQEIYDYAKKAVYLFIAYGRANKILPDGRNAHLIQQPPTWWEERLRKFDWKIKGSQVHHHKKTTIPAKGWFWLEK